ncbi:hypothetical protein [Flavobacterium sp.]|uniref:hypothetical protein n=1 Tax=Flavobacterium sp. TaxID=239 RepID=UPI00375299EF
MTITNLSQVAFCNSPVMVRIDLLTDFPTYVPPQKNTRIRLQLTTFDINDSLVETNVHTYVLDKARVSNEDKYVSFEIQDYLKNDLVRKDNLNNVDFPVLLYHNTSLPYIQGMCLFYRYSYYAYDETTSVAAINVTDKAATLGYRWRNEQNPFYGSFVGNANGFNISQTPIKKYAEYIPYYSKQDFVFGINRTSNNFVVTTQVIPSKTECVKEPLLLIYLDRNGLFQQLTTTGKIVLNTETKRQESQKAFRDSSMINTESTHFKNTAIEEVFQTYTVNTGVMDESMNALIEELIYSPKIYLIRFYGDRWTVAQQGITVDNNIVTVDNETITVDSDTVTVNDIGYYSTYLQVPVTCIDSDFVKKTTINDKREISYTIKFKETASKIKNQ